MRLRGWGLVLAGGAAVCVAVWVVRAAMWPCGALDHSSGCIASVPLDVADAGLDPASAVVDSRSFDLGPGGTAALVGITDRVETGTRSVLGVYDTATGALRQVLRDETLNGGGTMGFREVAFSPDGTRAAAVFGQVRDGGNLADVTETVELIVYDAAKGTAITTLLSGPADEIGYQRCMAMLDFTTDGSQLQCGGQVFDIADGTSTSLLVNDQYIYPMPADFPPGDRAPDGTVISASDLDAPVELYDADSATYFSPDSAVVLEVQFAYFQNRGLRWWTPPVFRELSAVTVWDTATRALRRGFTANRRYGDVAWARDGSTFGFVSDDLWLEVFTP